MPAVTLEQLLMAPVVTRVISTIKVPGERIQQWAGMQPGGPNVFRAGGHHTGWDVFDHTRKLATGRPPGTGPATVPKQRVGHVSATIYRFHEKIPLLQEHIFRIRPLGAQWGTIDANGQSYVTRQQAYLAQRFRNMREFMVSRMFRGSFQLLQSGDDWIPVDSGGHFTVDYQIPAGNKGQLDMLGTGNIIDVSWADPSANIIGHCLKINAAFEQLHGYPLRHIWCNSNVLQHMLRNTSLINAGGTANVVFSAWGTSPYVGPDNIPDSGHEVVFRGLPWLTVHVYDAGLDVNNTFTKFFSDTQAVFLPDPSPDLWEMHEGSEVVAENYNDPGSERYGLAAWSQRTLQPAGWELLAVDNCIPALYIPKSIANATVVF